MHSKKILNLRTRVINIPETVEKSCLIIGDGPTQKYIDMTRKYNVGAIICIHYPKHKYTDYVFSADITKFQEKEFQCVEQNIPLVYTREVFLPIPVPNSILFNYKLSPYNSGSIAIEWAMSRGYTHIYTAGLDFKTSGNSKEYRYMSDDMIIKINEFICRANTNTNFYKMSNESLLGAVVKTPTLSEVLVKNSPPTKEIPEQKNGLSQ